MVPLCLTFHICRMEMVITLPRVAMALNAHIKQLVQCLACGKQQWLVFLNTLQASSIVSNLTVAFLPSWWLKALLGLCDLQDFAGHLGLRLSLLLQFLPLLWL